MKKIFLSLSIVLFTLSFASAQKQAWKWYFSTNAAMDFSGGAPVALYNSAMNQFEGSASIADANGDLLFYTDGLSTWNKNHTLMPNGSGMLGDPSSTQSALIVPKPGSNTLYYIFVTSGFDAHYSEVDMTLQGGLGDVTANKNILLATNSAEKLSGVKAANGTDIWVAIHENSNQVFRAYLVTSGGVGAAVVTTVGSMLAGNIGQLQFSPDGKKAAMASYGAGNFETIDLFDFDNATGIFSNHLGLPTPNYFQTYGLEFSPNSKILYTGANPGINQVHQWNLDAGSNALIIASDNVVGNTLGDAGCLQLGPDGKVYVAQTGSTYAGVINNPDVYGNGCNYVNTGVNLSPKTMGLGLPNFIASFFAAPNPIGFSSSDTAVCQKFCINFFDSSQNNPTAWLWEFPGGSPSSSTLQNPTSVCYNNPGTYDVTLITTNAGGNDTLVLPDYITVFATPPFPTITQSGFVLTSSPASSYQWQLNSVDIPGATNQSYTVLQSGFYTVVAGDSNGCVNSATQYFLIEGIPGVDDPDISISPNPGDGLFTIGLTNTSQDKLISIEVINAIGQVVFYQKDFAGINQQKININLTDASRGIYFVELKMPNELVRKKIVIAK